MAKGKKEKLKKKIVLPSNWSLIPIGLVIAAIGACFIAFSSLLEYLALAVGIFVIVGASVLATATLLGKRSGALFVIKIIFSACILATGIITIVFMDYVAAIICVVFAAFIAVDGSIKLGTAAMARQYSNVARIVMSVTSVITTATALVMVRFTPSEITDDNITAASIIIGIVFVLDAMCNIATPFLKKTINEGIVNEFDNGEVEIETEIVSLPAPENEYEADYSDEIETENADEPEVAEEIEEAEADEELYTADEPFAEPEDEAQETPTVDADEPSDPEENGTDEESAPKEETSAESAAPEDGEETEDSEKAEDSEESDGQSDDGEEVDSDELPEDSGEKKKDE